VSSKSVLLVDAGNTSVKSALVSAGLAAPGPMSDVAVMSNQEAGIESLCEQWSSLAKSQHVRLGEPALVWVCVGPSALKKTIQDAYNAWSGQRAPEPCCAQSEQRLFAGKRVVRNAYQDPSQLGADRWVSAVGLAGLLDASALGNYLVVSAGTATTIDWIRVSQHGHELDVEFSGGWILPGLGLMQQSLRLGTAGLNYPAAMNRCGVQHAPSNSSDAIGQGIALAQAGFMGALADRFAVRELWLHGGAAEQWKLCLELTDPTTSLRKKLVMKPGLSLTGLAYLANFFKHARC
jgi:type III pantothenate kinase